VSDAEVSVLIPLFGQHQGERTLAAVCRAWAHQDIPCEVLVAVAGDVTIEASVPVYKFDVDSARANPGMLRNWAAERAVGSWLYLSDADVRPVGKDYLSRALRLADSGALAQPRMFRRIDHVLGGTLTDDSGWDRQLQQLPPSCCFIKGSPDGAMPLHCSDERYVWEHETPMVIPPEEIPVVNGELRWRPPFHWGGMLVRRAVFEELGGYHTGYVGWGCEDDDLLAKVGKCASITIAWREDASLSCVHYEHARPYDNARFGANRRLLAQRIADGAEAMIRADISAIPRTHGEGWPTCVST
jgi:hypothetical protein